MEDIVKRRIISILMVLSLVVVGMLGTVSVVGADPPPKDPFLGPPAFLCPAVGNANAAAHNGQGWFPIAVGNANAAAHNGQGWFPIASGDYSFFPGNNQAGAHANGNGYNAEGPGASPGPGGGNNEWSPIWPGGPPS
jgi:hypothetical protein